MNNKSKTNADLKLLLQQFDHLMEPKAYMKQMETEVEND